jgi:hypothetical protein
MRVEFERSAESVIGAAMAAALDPPEPITPSQWAPKNFVLADGEYVGQVIDLARTPYQGAIDSPVTKTPQAPFLLMLITNGDTPGMKLTAKRGR